MALLPRFTIVDSQRGLVRYACGDGASFKQFNVRDLDVDDVLGLFRPTHPDFEAMRAAALWLRGRGLRPVDLLNAANRTAYLAATYTPMTVSA